MLPIVRIRKEQLLEFKNSSLIMLIIFGLIQLSLPVLFLSRIPYLVSEGVPKGENMSELLFAALLILFFLSFVTISGVSFVLRCSQELLRRKKV